MLEMVQDLCHQALTALTDFSSRAPGTLTTQTLAVGTLVGFLMSRLLRRRYRLPPGPWTLPLLGNLLSLPRKEQFYVALDRWAREKFGPVISVYLGPVLCVTLNDLNSVNEALVIKGNKFAGRPSFHSIDILMEGPSDIALAGYNPAWKLRRKIAMMAIRHYMTGSHMETAVQRVVDMVINKMISDSRPFIPDHYNSNLMFHILNCICFSEAKPLDDPSTARACYIIVHGNDHIGNGFFEDIVPLLKYWPTTKYRKTLAMNVEFLTYIEQNIQKHRDSFNPDNMRDITDAILLAQSKAEREESAEDMAMFTDVHVRQIINDVFVAGVDTSRMTMDWVILFLAGHPEVQKRVQEEIDLATGPGRMPGMGDRVKLQYTEAMLYESMRMGPVLPFSLPHKTTCDTTVGGYDVPKDTLVMVNLWAVTHDPALWDQPDLFRPERFLDQQGKLKSPKPDGWLPFSAGRRVCLGESVAKPELLLIIACLLQRLTFSLPPGQSYTLAPKTASFWVHEPEPFTVVATPR